MLFPINLNHAFSRSILLGNEEKTHSFYIIFESDGSYPTEKESFATMVTRVFCKLSQNKRTKSTTNKAVKDEQRRPIAWPGHGKRPLKDISNNADPKQRLREKDSERKRSARARVL